MNRQAEDDQIARTQAAERVLSQLHRTRGDLRQVEYNLRVAEGFVRQSEALLDGATVTLLQCLLARVVAIEATVDRIWPTP